MNPTKLALLGRGAALMDSFCALNSLGTAPELRIAKREDWHFGKTCAYYRPTYIAICPDACAALGYAGRAWSWPGHYVDRTPYGVVQHELGHHTDYHERGEKTGPYSSDYSRATRSLSREKPLTGYCPNDAEWFAEMFRLFVTNPDLLYKIRPRTYGLLRARWRPAIDESWDEVLRAAPERTLDMAHKKVREAA